MLSDSFHISYKALFSNSSYQGSITMKVFVPRYRHTLPPTNPRLLVEMMLEIDPQDLRNVIDLWEKQDSLEDIKLEEYFSIGAKNICLYPTHRNTLEPYLRRPHISVNCGSQEGSEEIAPQALDLIRRTGTLIARNGFNLRYGGGQTGLMGAVHQAFLDELKKQRYPDQYSMQISPGPFVFGVKSVNGSKPVNEGLSSNSDVVIVMPDFYCRRDMLNSTSTASFSGFGATGTIDESTDVAAHNKIGMRKVPLYMLDAYVPAYGHGFWSSLRKQFEIFVSAGYERPTIWDHLRFMDSPEKSMDHLMAMLDAEGRNPHTIYQENCRERGVKPFHYGTEVTPPTLTAT